MSPYVEWHVTWQCPFLEIIWNWILYNQSGYVTYNDLHWILFWAGNSVRWSLYTESWMSPYVVWHISWHRLLLLAWNGLKWIFMWPKWYITQCRMTYFLCWLLFQAGNSLKLIIMQWKWCDNQHRKTCYITLTLVFMDFLAQNSIYLKLILLTMSQFVFWKSLTHCLRSFLSMLGLFKWYEFASMLGYEFTTMWPQWLYACGLVVTFMSLQMNICWNASLCMEGPHLQIDITECC